MPNSYQPYRMIGVSPGRTVERPKATAPTPAQMATFADVNKVDFVVRYYPSKKAWMANDMRKRRKMNLRSGRVVWDSRSVLRHDRKFPNEDAAVVWAMTQLGVAPVTQ